MSLAPEVVEKLAAPLALTRIKHREGSGGRSLSYLEGHDVIRTANEVFGIGNWSYYIDNLTLLGEEPVVKTYNGQTREGFRVAYRAIVCVVAGTHSFSDVGFGDAMEYTGSKLTPHELASKEAVTDALKRALKNFGDQFGLCLYDKDAPEHSGRNGSAGTVGGTGGQAAVTERTPTPASPAASNFEAPVKASGSAATLAWKYGPHAGMTIAETPLDFVINYAANKTGFMADKCKEFLAENGHVEDDPDSDVPF